MRTVYLALNSDANGGGQRAARQLGPAFAGARVDAFPVELADGHDPNSFFADGGRCASVSGAAQEGALMSYAAIYRADLGSAYSPFRVVALPTGREVGWINRFLDQCCVRGLAWHTLRGYAFDLTDFIRWWADRHSTDEVTEHALTTSSLLDYLRYQAKQQPRPAANTINKRVCGLPNVLALPIPQRHAAGGAGLPAVLLATVGTRLWPLSAGADASACESSKRVMTPL